MIPYSSGTSGLPKGVVLTHRNVVANLVQISANRSLNAISSDDVVLGVLPFFHIYGMVIVLNFALRCGAHVVTMPGFDPPLFLRLLKAHGVSAARLVERAVCLPALPSHGPQLGSSATPASVRP